MRLRRRNASFSAIVGKASRERPWTMMPGGIWSGSSTTSAAAITMSNLNMPTRKYASAARATTRRSTDASTASAKVPTCGSPLRLARRRSVVGRKRLGIHGSERANCGCCGLDRKGQWCLFVFDVFNHVSFGGTLSIAMCNESPAARRPSNLQEHMHSSISCGPMSMRPTALCWS